MKMRIPFAALLNLDAAAETKEIAGVALTTITDANHRDIDFLIQITPAHDVGPRKSCSCSDGGAGFQK